VSALINAWVWVETVLAVIIGWPVFCLVYAVTAPFDPGRYAAGRTFRLIAVTTVKLNPLWRFETSGERVRDPRRPYVAVSNHESWADVFLISHLPFEMKWLSKDTIFRIPLMGWMMQLSGDIKLYRGKKASAVQALLAARDRLAKRVSVMIFPEGTRSRDGNLLPFKDGAFRIAIETGTPILPLVVAGTRRAMAKGSFRFQRARARVQVLPPVETAGLTIDDVGSLRDRVRTMIAEARVRLQADLDAL
jgi:1-acyl-sn-glycerol-3-phosphate acyltransferase